MVANSSSTSKIHSARHRSPAQLTYGRGIKNLTITGGTFYSTPGNLHVRRQHVSGSSNTTSSVFFENHNFYGTQSPPVERDIHILDNPQGSVTITGGMHALVGGCYIEESIGLPYPPNYNERSNADNRRQRPIGYARTSGAAQTQYAHFNTPLPGLPFEASDRAQTTLFSNARGDIVISDATIVASIHGAVMANGPVGISAAPAQMRVASAPDYVDGDVHIFRGAQVVDAIRGDHIITGDSIEVTNYIPQEYYGGARVKQAAPDSACPLI